jgi:exosortase/archaeosortase family protein
LFILSTIAGFLFLRTPSRRVILALAIFPITVVKNAFRIVTITLLANYVDMHFITNHWLHRSGGIPFFAVALAMFIPLVWVLRRTEARERAAGSGQKHRAQRIGHSAKGRREEAASGEQAGSRQLAAGSEPRTAERSNRRTLFGSSRRAPMSNIEHRRSNDEVSERPTSAFEIHHSRFEIDLNP